MKRLFVLALALAVLTLPACTDLGERVTFDVGLDGNILHVCASFDLNPADAAEVNQAMIETFGRRTGTVNTTTDKIWNAKSVGDLITVIRQARQYKASP